MFYLHTLPGLGPLAWQEATGQEFVAPGARAAGKSPIRFVPGKNDIVLLRGQQKVSRLLGLRVSEDVFAIVARGFHIAPDQQGRRQMYAAVRHSRMVGDAMAAWAQARHTRRVPATFRVVTRIVGKHEFRRRDVGQTVAEAILAGWPGRWRQVDEDADIEVWVNLLGNELLCGVRLSDASMRHRGRTGAQSAGWQHRPAALRPALAAAMVMLTEPAPGDIFLDPMAGSGTLPIERAAAGPFQQLYASDRDSAAYAALQANTRHIDGNVQCERWDARRLPLPDHGIDKVAVNLPFGKQVAAEMDLARLYRDVLHELQRVIRPGGRLVVLVGDMRLFDAAYKDSAPAWHPGARHRVEALGQPATIRVLVKAEA